MKNQNETPGKQYQHRAKRNTALLVLSVLVAVFIIAGVLLIKQPERSVASFCSVAKQEKSILTTDAGYEKRLEAYKKLEAVSPDDIRSDITTIRKGYESIVQNPSNTISAGLGMSGAENRRSDYITKNCPDF